MDNTESKPVSVVPEPVKATPKKRAPKTAEFVAKVNGSIEGASGTKHVVKRGDTISAPANEFDHVFTDGSCRQLRKK
ncbi:hypothetical protein OAF54_02760 [bacterium]|nr:hypothetical protein [bacterium]